MTILKFWQSAVAVLLALLFWGGVLALPSVISSLQGVPRYLLGLVGVILIAVAIVTGRAAMAQEGEERAERFGITTIFAILGVLVILWAVFFTKDVTVAPSTRFALGVGGAALAGFVYAVTRFDTMRAAASVPVVLLLVGIIVWPGAKDFVEANVRQALITWMGIILAANGVAEAAKQIGDSNAQAKARAGTIRQGTGDLAQRTIDPP